MNERHFGMDWLRIGAFALLILYHSGMAFVPWDWHVKAGHTVIFASVPMNALNAWRLGLLFVVSGYASAALIARTGGGRGFAWSRTKRLMVPTLVAMAVVIPPQPWVELMVKHGYAQSYFYFWSRDYFRFGAIDGIDVPTWQHLWFVVYLWVYSLALVGLRGLIGTGRRAALLGMVERTLSGWRLLAIPIGLLLLRAWLVRSGETHDLFTDVAAHSLYPGMFLFGIALHSSPRLRGEVASALRPAAILAIGAYAVVAAIDIHWPGDAVPPEPFTALFRSAHAVQCWATIVALVAVAVRYWNRDHRWRPMLSEAVFPFYIVHQTIIVLVVWSMRPLDLGAGSAFAITVIATAAGCWAFYLTGRSIGTIRPLIGLNRVERTRVPAREAVTA